MREAEVEERRHGEQHVARLVAVEVVQRGEHARDGVGEEFVGGDHTPHYHRATDTFDRIDFTYLARITRLALDVLADVIRRSTFPPEEIEREREVILQELGDAAQHQTSTGRKEKGRDQATTWDEKSCHNKDSTYSNHAP